MALKTILNQQTDFTGEFPAEWAKDGLWRMNESAPDENNNLLDSSGAGRPAFINNWSGTTASMRSGQKGNYFRFNINSPATEQTYLKVANDGSIFAELGGRILCGGWAFFSVLVQVRFVRTVTVPTLHSVPSKA